MVNFIRLDLHMVYLIRGRILRTLIFFFLFFVYAEAQEMVRLTTEQGLSQGFVTCLTQDKTGYIWVGTLNGLNRFDGYSFKVYNHVENNPQSLYSDAIQSLTVDERGVLWVLSSAGIQVYDQELDAFKGFEELSKFEKRKFESTSLIRDNQLIFVVEEKVWTYAINHDDRGTVSLKFISVVPCDIGKMGGAIYSLKIRNASIWLGAKSGIYSLSPSGHLERIFPEIKEAVYEIWQDEIHRQLLIQTTEGVYLQDEGGNLQLFKGIGGNYGTGLSGKKLGDHYLLFGGNQLWRWTGRSLEKTEVQFDVNITAAFVDRKENIWLGLDAVGLVCIQNKKKAITNIMAVGKPAFNRTIEDQKGGIWVFNKLKKSENAVDFGYYTNYKRHNNVGLRSQERLNGYQMDMDESGVKWLIDEHQHLIKINPKGEKSRFLITNIQRFNILFGVTCLSDRRLLLLSNNCREACFIDKDGRSILVNNLDQFSGGNLGGFSSLNKPSEVSPWVWIASPSDVFGIKPDWETMQVSFRKLDPKKLPIKIQQHQRIIFAIPDNFDADVVWIGTWEGLFKWNLTTDLLQEVSSNNGPIRSPVFTMAQSDTNILWIGLRDGLLRLNAASGESRLFTTSDGLPATEFNRNTTTVGEDGKIIMGTVNGYISFYPDELSGREVPEQMVITSVWQGTNSLAIHQSGSIASITELPFEESNLMVHFSMLDYSNMQAPQYRFRYGDSDGDWYYNGLKNTVSLAGLSPGRYVFEVQGSLDGSLWSQPVFLVFVVGKPWWAEWWVLTLFALGMLSVGYIIIRNRRQLLKEKYRNELLQRESQHEAEIIAAKERILTNVAHDLRTPITLITGMANRLPEKADDKIKRSVETIRKQSSDLLSMVNQILDLGRIREFGTLPLKPRVIDLDQFLKNLVADYSYQAELKLIQLDYVVEGALPKIYLDENGLRAIIGNLLSNALKITPSKGKVVVQATVSGPSLLLSVQDTGPGVLPEEIDRIFDRYYQSDSQSKIGGVGIGLAYASEMAELMGGSLRCEKNVASTRGIGALFVVEFLLDKIAVDPQEVQKEALVGSEKDSAEGRLAASARSTILLVEDNPEMASYIREFLEPTFDVVVAQDGTKGLDCATAIIPDVIISDVMMPGMSGLELCQSLKADLRTSHIPLIMLTAKVGEQALKDGLICGASVYLTKPFESATLLQYIANCLHLKEQTRRYFERRWATSEEGIQIKSQEGERANVVVAQEDGFINRINSILEQRYSDDQYTVEQLASELNLTPGQLRRKVAALGGGSVVNLIRAYRLEKSKALLRSKKYSSIAEIAFACGFGDPNYFSSIFSKTYGISPTNYRKNT